MIIFTVGNIQTSSKKRKRTMNFYIVGIVLFVCVAVPVGAPEVPVRRSVSFASDEPSNNHRCKTVKDAQLKACFYKLTFTAYRELRFKDTLLKRLKESKDKGDWDKVFKADVVVLQLGKVIAAIGEKLKLDTEAADAGEKFEESHQLMNSMLDALREYANGEPIKNVEKRTAAIAKTKFVKESQFSDVSVSKTHSDTVIKDLGDVFENMRKYLILDDCVNCKGKKDSKK